MVGTPCSSPHLSILWLRVIFLVFFKPSYSCCLSMSPQFAVVSRRSLRCLSQAGASPLSTPLDPVAAKLCFWLVIDLGKNFLASPSVEKDLCLVFVQNHCLWEKRFVFTFFSVTADRTTGLCGTRRVYFIQTRKGIWRLGRLRVSFADASKHLLHAWISSELSFHCALSSNFLKVPGRNELLKMEAFRFGGTVWGLG